MSLLWAVPPVAMATAAAIVLVQLRGIATSAAALQVELQRFSEVRVEVQQLRSASAETRALARSLGRG